MNNEQSNCHLRLSRDEMCALGYRVIDILVEHFEELPQKPVTRIPERAGVAPLDYDRKGLAVQAIDALAKKLLHANGAL